MIIETVVFHQFLSRNCSPICIALQLFCNLAYFHTFPLIVLRFYLSSKIRTQNSYKKTGATPENKTKNRPRITSLGIHPCTFMRSSQLPMTCRERAGSNRLSSRWWNPSSQRKPRGKNGLLGTDVNNVCGPYGTG